MKRMALLLSLLAIFIGYAGWNFMDAMTPYVSIAEARKELGNVQVKGVLAQNASGPHNEGQEFVFTLQDENTGETMLVRYRGMKPDQFDSAYHIVAVGKYREDTFYADKLLIKCPSKYEKQKQVN